MKRTLSLLLTLVMVVSVFLSTRVTVNAATAGVTGNCIWSLDGTVLTISGNGMMGDYSYSSSRPWGTKITEVIIEDGLLNVGDSAFVYCRNLTSVTIANSVKTIGERAFQFCENLKLATIPNSVTSIGYCAFFGCTNLNSIIIPDSVTYIGDCAFACCDSLVSFNVGKNNNNYLSVDGVLFNKDQTTLIQHPAKKQEIEFVIPDTVSSIREYAFYSCANLTSVVIPEKVKCIYDSTFYGCRNLSSITIPRSLKAIDCYAFDYCTNLENVYITDIASWCAISYLYDYEWVYPSNPLRYAKNLYLNGELVTNIIIPEGVTSISKGAFYGFTGLESVIIPESVTDIGMGAFSGCTNLSTITIPSGVETIGDSAFNGCTSLKDICYYGSSEDWERIKISDFENERLTQATIHFMSVEQVYDSLTFVLNADGESYCISDCDTALEGTLVIPEFYNGLPVVSIGDFAFSQCQKLVSIVIPNSVKTINHDAFNGCTSLIITVIPNSVTSIGGYVFYGCTNLSFVTLSDNVENIEDGTFYDCKKLKSIIIPNGVRNIGAIAFHGCDNLFSIKLPTSLMSLGWYAFGNCCSLKSIEIPRFITNIEGMAFSGCTNLASVTIPNSVTSIGAEAFRDCTSLRAISIPTSVINIGECAFYGCTSLKDVYYSGNFDERNDIDIEGFNEPLLNAIWHYALSIPATQAATIINGINISWNSVKGAIKYTVYRRNAGSSVWTAIGTTTNTSFIDKNVTSGNYYIYSVRAYNSNGEYSDYDSTKTKTIMYMSTPSTSTTNLLNGVQVKWNSVAGATKYNVYRRIGGSSSWVLLGSPTGTSFVDKNVKNGTYYVYSVRAVNGANISAFDTNKTVTIQPITAPTAVATNLTNGVQITWSKATGATKYNVYRRTAGSSTWALMGTTTGTSLVDKSVTNGTYYVYSIRAINGTGYSAFDTSKTDTIQPITAPTAKVAKKSNGVQVSWNSVSGATKYNVYRRLGGTSTWVYAGQTTGTSFIDTGVVKGKSYAYSIRAINGTGYSAYNSSKCATIKYS